MTPIEIAKIQEYLRRTFDNDRIFIDRNAMAMARQDLLADRFPFERRGIIEVKGKGRVETFFLTGRSQD